MDAPRLESYSKALAEEFEDRDIVAFMDWKVKQRRPEFEPKIPELGDFLEMIREWVGARRHREAEAERKAEHDRYLQDQKDHPENYVTLKEVWDELNGRMLAGATVDSGQ